MAIRTSPVSTTSDQSSAKTSHDSNTLSSSSLNIQQPLLTDRLQATVEVILCSGFPTQLLLIFALATIGWSPLDKDNNLSLSFISLLSLLDTVLLVVLIRIFMYIRDESPHVMFLGSRLVKDEIKVGLFCIPIALLLVSVTLMIVQQLAPWLDNVLRNPLEDLMSGPLEILLLIIVAVIAGGLREEIQRAFILARFEQYLGGGLIGLVVFSLVFGAGHVLQGWDAAIATAVLGAGWGALYLARRSIVAAVVSHSAFNILEIIHRVVTIEYGLQ